KGETADSLSEADAAAVQDGHLAHLASLHEAGMLVAAGPTMADADVSLRGFGLFRVPPDEAQRLMAEDPAVRAGRLKAEVVEWRYPAGALAFASVFFPRSIADV